MCTRISGSATLGPAWAQASTNVGGGLWGAPSLTLTLAAMDALLLIHEEEEEAAWTGLLSVKRELQPALF